MYVPITKPQVCRMMADCILSLCIKTITVFIKCEFLCMSFSSLRARGAETPAESQFVLSRIVQPPRPQITAQINKTNTLQPLINYQPIMLWLNCCMLFPVSISACGVYIPNHIFLPQQFQSPS